MRDGARGCGRLPHRSAAVTQLLNPEVSDECRLRFPERCMLVVEGLTCRFGTKTAVDNASFSVAPGSFVGVIGRSGAGKSTLLRMINRLAEPTSGRIVYRRRRCHGAAGARLAEVARPFGHGVPAVQSDRPSRCADQRADGASGDGFAGAGAVETVAGRRQGDRAGRARTVRDRIAGGAARRPAFRRPAAARRHRPRPGAGAGHHSGGRADRLARSAQHQGGDGRARSASTGISASP